jgi:hypothetical protein
LEDDLKWIAEKLEFVLTVSVTVRWQAAGMAVMTRQALWKQDLFIS